MNTKTMSPDLGPHFEMIAADSARALEELHLPQDAAILDVGTGAGKFAICLALEGYQVLTGEPSTDESQYAGRDWAANAAKAGVQDRIRFEHFDAANLPFAAGTFDAVFFFGVLHHIDEGARAVVLGEALRVLKGDGRGAVVFFEPRQETLERLWVEDPGHPLAANPSRYLPEATPVRETRIEGSMMDIFIYRPGPSTTPRLS